MTNLNQTSCIYFLPFLDFRVLFFLFFDLDLRVLFVLLFLLFDLDLRALRRCRPRPSKSAPAPIQPSAGATGACLLFKASASSFLCNSCICSICFLSSSSASIRFLCAICSLLIWSNSFFTLFFLYIVYPSALRTVAPAAAFIYGLSQFDFFLGAMFNLAKKLF